MTTSFCLDILDKGIRDHKKPEIVNTDQGSQYTSNEWVKWLNDNDIKISMDGKGRWVDNVMIERFGYVLSIVFFNRLCRINI
jgi:putative transposase